MVSNTAALKAFYWDEKRAVRLDCFLVDCWDVEKGYQQADQTVEKKVSILVGKMVD